MIMVKYIRYNRKKIVKIFCMYIKINIKYMYLFYYYFVIFFKD